MALRRWEIARLRPRAQRTPHAHLTASRPPARARAHAPAREAPRAHELVAQNNMGGTPNSNIPNLKPLRVDTYAKPYTGNDQVSPYQTQYKSEEAKRLAILLTGGL